MKGVIKEQIHLESIICFSVSFHAWYILSLLWHIIITFHHSCCFSSHSEEMMIINRLIYWSALTENMHMLHFGNCNHINRLALISWKSPCTRIMIMKTVPRTDRQMRFLYHLGTRKCLIPVIERNHHYVLIIGKCSWNNVVNFYDFN